MILRDALPAQVRVVEVGPRDGLQNEPAILPLESKLMFVTHLAGAGLPVIEAGAFVRPDRVPQMADTDELFRRLGGVRGPVLAALVPNRRGLERA
ncbi:MAG TPA: hydroxymethylglutaryl-CoA lyase, partial [bacterium]|nr:hydroxymethylglutaryl-CoA lyase [bacterium]